MQNQDHNNDSRYQNGNYQPPINHNGQQLQNHPPYPPKQPPLQHRNIIKKSIEDIIRIVLMTLLSPVILFFVILDISMIFSRNTDEKGGAVLGIMFTAVLIAMFVVLFVYHKKANMTQKAPKQQFTGYGTMQRQTVQPKPPQTLQSRIVQPVQQRNPQSFFQPVPTQNPYLQTNIPQPAQVQNPIAEAPPSKSSSTLQPEKPLPSISATEFLLLKIDSVSTSGEYFENIACAILIANGFTNVETTKSTNDYGIDILAEKEGITYGIQCKCYSSSVGNKAVQEAASGKLYYNRMVAAVLTNSSFTKSAIETAKATQVLLWDRTKLTEMLNKIPDKKLTELVSKSL